MSATTAVQKSSVVKQYQKHDRDTGSSQVQVALITSRINMLQDHFNNHPKDHHSRRGLLQLVGQRRRLLDYIRGKDVQAYRSLIQELGVRK